MTDTERIDALEQVLQQHRDIQIHACSSKSLPDCQINHGARTAYGWGLRDVIDAMQVQRAENVSRKLTE